ncbi:MAG: hypothetical protein A3F43_04340 [Gammaproteobacteria bacterium RIFCSPHIGHO2_12_FULL_42_10]|nr:MAG: hypothetical protein A3F43_04340 [Gammaproteobacteria bacterium RIFCSPHIGHO2_12_FULL_42_10]
MQNTKKILRIALPTPLNRLFEYVLPEAIDPRTLQQGLRVRVPFQSRTLIGWLIEITDHATIAVHKLKPILEVIDQTPLLPNDLYQLCLWAADYYHSPLGEVLTQALPEVLRKGKATQSKLLSPPLVEEGGGEKGRFNLNAMQLKAAQAILKAQSFRVFLLDGVTGSGKTAVYIHVIQQIIAEGKQALILVPEISLTPQIIERFQTHFQVPINMLHSGLPPRERFLAWQAARSGMARIVIGTRSAIFAPFNNLGLIVVDEEHDASFKQQDRFRYHARDLAIVRGKINQAPVILGSATPSLESLHNANRDRYTYLALPERAGLAVMPSYQVVDLRQGIPKEGLSQNLLLSMRTHLANQNQVMLFLNRRGFAPVLYCTSCGWIAECKHCDSRLVYHQKSACLQCHYCNNKRAIPTQCEKCHQETLLPLGLGTERLEKTLAKHFPDVPIIRVDRDNTKRRGATETLITAAHQCKTAILLGTQMLAKGHHFPNVTLVGIIDADSGLFSADFRATEQMGQLIVQVAGRAGREEKKGTVIIQTRYPEHILLQTLIQHGYTLFTKHLLTERAAATHPPFSFTALIRAEARTADIADAFLEAVKQLKMLDATQITLLGPVSALLAKRRGMYCQQLLVRANHRQTMQQFLKGIRKQIDDIARDHAIRWVIDVDPVAM